MVRLINCMCIVIFLFLVLSLMRGSLNVPMFSGHFRVGFDIKLLRKAHVPMFHLN